MLRSVTRRPATARRPAIEGLEDRLLMTLNGGRWKHRELITYSFAPDGTSIGGIPSNMNSALAGRGIATAAWQQAIAKAAAIWQAVANINLALVPDSGAPFATSGNQQGDARFGDIRIGGVPGNPTVLASSFLPPPRNGGTLAGDIVFNTSQSWRINNDYDLLTVAIHEFGHSLGLDHSTIASAAMYASYNTMKQSLTGDDTSSIQALYGQPTADANNSSANATVVNLDALGQAALGGQDIAGVTDSDWFSVVAPAGTTGTLKVTVQSTGLSSLSPRVLIYNSAMAGLTSASASPSTYGATITATVAGVAAGSKFYIKVMAGNGGAGGDGAYGLLVNTGSASQSPIPPPNTAVPEQPDQGGGSSDEGAGGLLGGLLNELSQITIGSLTAAGDELKARPSPRHGPAPRPDSGSPRWAIPFGAPTDGTGPIAQHTHGPRLQRRGPRFP